MQILWVWHISFQLRCANKPIFDLKMMLLALAIAWSWLILLYKLRHFYCLNTSHVAFRWMIYKLFMTLFMTWMKYMVISGHNLDYKSSLRRNSINISFVSWRPTKNLSSVKSILDSKLDSSKQTTNLHITLFKRYLALQFIISFLLFIYYVLQHGNASRRAR